MKLSIIIPLYNCEKYIIRCLESIYRQNISLDDFEVIVVNDGSNDNGPNLVKRYKDLHKFPNLTLFNKENGGVSSARNLGIGKAKGDYIHFIDADDYILKGKDHKLLIEGNNNVDVIKFRSETTSLDDVLVDTSVLIDSPFYGSCFDYTLLHGFNVSVATSLYRRSFLLKNNIFFEPFSISEDFLFNVRWFNIANATILYIPKRLYGYYNNDLSASRSINFMNTKRLIYDYGSIRSIVYKEYINLCDNRLVKHLNTTIESFKSITLNKIFRNSQSSYGQIKELIEACKQNGLYPIESSDLKSKIKNIFFSSPLLCYLASRLKK